MKYLASSRLLIALIESPSPFSGTQAGQKFVIYHCFFSFIRRIWHTPRGGIHDVVRDVSAKRLACQMVYSRYYESAQNSISHLSSVYIEVSSLSSFVSHVSSCSTRSETYFGLSSCLLLFQLPQWNCNCFIVMHKSFNYKDTTSSNILLREARILGNLIKFISRRDSKFRKTVR